MTTEIRGKDFSFFNLTPSMEVLTIERSNKGEFMFKVALIVLMLSGLTACSSWTHRRSPNQEVVMKDSSGKVVSGHVIDSGAGAAATPEVHETTSTPANTQETEAHVEAQAQAEEMKDAVAAAAAHVQATHGKSRREAGPVPAEKALSWLKNGNTRFVKGFFRKDGALATDRKRLTVGQHPHSAVFTTSDSRIPPEVLFDQKLGEIFVVRTLGLSLGDNVVGSLEYAVMYLGVNNIVILGQDSGNITAAAQAMTGLDLGSPAMNSLANDMKPRLNAKLSTKPGNAAEESWWNTEGVAKDLLERSAILRDAVASGDVKINKSMYHLDTGRVTWR
jgi:carbonic anhydrase